MSQRSVVILSGVRTAIGDYGGSLKDIAPPDLGARAVREAIARAKVDPNDVGQCVIGNVIHTEPKDMYLGRVAALDGGRPGERGDLRWSPGGEIGIEEHGLERLQSAIGPGDLDRDQELRQERREEENGERIDAQDLEWARPPP